MTNRGLTDPTRPELDADPRTHRPRRLWHRMLPGALAGTAHHQQVAVADLMLDGGAAAARPKQEVAGGAQRDDGDDRVGRLPPADGVTVSGDRVAAVPIEAHSCRTERLAQLGLVVRGQRIPRSGESRIGQRLILAVETQ